MKGMSRLTWGVCLVLGLVEVGSRVRAIAQMPSPLIAQVTDIESRISPSVLAEIREAPFSEVFTVADGTAFGVKDRDYNPSNPQVGVFSLWADIPQESRLEVVVKYCVLNLDIARNNSSLVQISLLSGDDTQLIIDQVLESGTAETSEVRPPQTVNGVSSSAYYYDPFFNPYFTSPYAIGITYSPPITLSGVDCSAGATRFDLAPVRAALQALPTETLRMELLFSDGNIERWNLGSGTVGAVKSLPSLQL
jgi:hypothetical protein